MRYVMIGLLFFLTACLQAPKKSAFIVDYDRLEPAVVLKATDKQIAISHTLSADKQRVVLPTALDEIVRRWLESRFTIDHQTDQQVVFDVQQMEMVKDPRPILKWYVFNNEEYTLSYQIRFSVLKQGQTVYYAIVKGQVKEQLPVKSSLMDKEKVWADMISRMIFSAEHKFIQQIPNEFKSV